MTTSHFTIYPTPPKWKIVSLDDIKAQEKHSCVAGPFGSKISSKFFVDSGIPVIRGSNLKDDLTRFIPDNFVYITDEKAKEFIPQRAIEGDLIFTCWGTIGQIGIIPKNGCHPYYIISNKQLKLRLNSKIADPLFCYYYLSSPKYVQYIKDRNIGGAIPGINLGILKALKISLPNITVQHRIASILSTYDDLIENNRRRIALLEQSVRLLYQEWFVRFRFPGHEKVKIVDGVPKGWTREKLHEIAGVNLNSIGKNYSGEIEYIDISSVSTGNIDTTTYYDFKTAPSRARRLVNDGDIIWSCVRPNRKSYAIMTKPKSNLVVSTGFAVITPTKVPTAYLYHAITTDNYVEYLTKHARGAAYPAVTASDFENSFILVPSPELLNLFDKYTQELLILKQTLSIQNEKLAAARDLLLPRLMSGEIAV